MPTYAIGDVQGCRAELEALLDRISFDPSTDRAWFVGDLVNRGPDSLGTLRLIRSLGEATVAVLGNHDLHLLAAAHGVREPRRKDTFGDVLEAPERDEWLDWLRHLPVIHHDPELDVTMVHAGLAPAWTIEAALGHAAELEAVLRGDRLTDYLAHMYGNQPDLWSERLDGWDRLRYLTNAFTRIRYVDRGGRLDFEESGAPGSQRQGLVPWFAHPDRVDVSRRIVFGHWATLQTEAPLDASLAVRHVDTGCVWGGSMTALRLDDDVAFTVPAGSRRQNR